MVMIQNNTTKQDAIAAVIVSYNGKDTIEKCLMGILPQVNTVIVVDNASNDNTIELVQKIQPLHPNIQIIQNQDNVGLATALNQGVKAAIHQGYAWVMTLDDDSVAEPDMVEKMFAAYQTLPPEKQAQTAVIAPNYTNIKGIVYKEPKPFFITTAITSGQIVKAELFNKMGEFKNDFFIECIDQEFCLRTKKFDLKILLVPDAILKQRLGNPTVRRFLWRKVAVSNHAPLRYYYIFRNSAYLYIHYLHLSPKWIIKNFFYNLFLLLKVIFFEKLKGSKFKMVLLGFMDATRGRYGKKIIQ